jgi:Tol biopolymer transport system component
MIGSRLNHYRVVAALGSGGMGEVYAAEDTRLHRTVALKVLPRAIADDPERRQRLEREARAVAALSHPNIVTIHSIEEADATVFVTMELVQGRRVSELIPPKGLSIERLLSLAIPLADAVDAAHQKGIIHRDLKPDNLMVGADERLKVLDFGLARLEEDETSADALTTFRTEDRSARLIGTVPYMSPEQADGRPVDHRSDIFSIGIVLFEMATGQRPFTGDTPLAVLSSIASGAAPAVTTINPALPPELGRIVRRCLAKDPGRRYQRAADMRNDLEDLRDNLLAVPLEGPAPARGLVRGRRLNWLAWGVAAAALIVAAVALLTRPAAVEPSRDVFALVPADGTTLAEGEAPQVSPDGRMIAFVATDEGGRTLLYVRDRDSATPRALAETDDALQPFWSPDSRALGFFSGGQLKRVVVAGGRPLVLATAPVPRGGTWSRDDVILYVPFPEQPVHRIGANGGEPVPLSLPTGDLRWFPAFLPDGRHYVYLVFRNAEGRPGVRLGSIDASSSTDLLPAARTAAVFVEPDVILFRREGALFAQRFDTASLALQEAPQMIAENVTANPITGQGGFSAARSAAVLAYLERGHDWQLGWFDQQGRRLGEVGRIGSSNSLCLGDGDRRIVHDAADVRTGNVDLWSRDANDGTATRLTFHEGTDFYAACSPAGNEVVFASPRTGTPNVYRLDTRSPGSERLVATMPMPSLPTQWTLDGRHVVFSAYSPETNWDIWLLPLDGEEPRALVATEAEERNGQLSPNGRWIAFTASQTGRDEVFVQSASSGGGRWQVSPSGGRQPQWSRDGKQLFYISLQKTLMASVVETAGSSFIAGPPRVISPTRVGGWERTHQGNPYAITGDGQRILIANAADERLPVTVMLNSTSLVFRD